MAIAFEVAKLMKMAPHALCRLSQHTVAWVVVHAA